MLSVAFLHELAVLAVDCQATAASPRGHLLELGWTRVPASGAQVNARLIRLPQGERIPPAVWRITGITDAMMRSGVDAQTAWRELCAEAAGLPQQPAPAVAHFARFEQPFLDALAGSGGAIELVCTHEIARRLLPDLPRCSLRALAGYFGRGVGALRRSADHVEATAFVWRALIGMLHEAGVDTWIDLREWLASPPAPVGRRRRAWPMPRADRLAAPHAPGIYRMLRSSGDVLYVGKASSLHHRVNSYFRKQHGVPERTLEMLSQARAVSFELTPTALEAALLEADEIKRHRPPYNIAFAIEHRCAWFARHDLGERSATVSERCPLGPFPSAETLDQFAALAAGSAAALGSGRWAPARTVFEAGYARFRAAHPELAREDLDPRVRLLRLGTRLWREGRRDRDVDLDDLVPAEPPLAAWTPEIVQITLEWLVLRAALARRRARWLTRLMEAAILWCEPGQHGARLIVVENGDIAVHDRTEPDAMPPVPPGHKRSAIERRTKITTPRLDRLRVLTTELKRLAAAGAVVMVRFGTARPLASGRLARVLAWV